MIYLIFLLFYLRISSLHTFLCKLTNLKLKRIRGPEIPSSLSYGVLFIFFQFLFSIFFKIRPSVLSGVKRLDLFHPFYNQFLYSALFLHLIIKFLLFLFSIFLDSEMNIILLLICISISSIIDVYHYITYPFYIIGKYCYTTYISHQLHGMDTLVYLPLESVECQYCGIDIKLHPINYRVDLYYFLRLIFMFFIFIRYWIIREPYFFAAVNTVIIISYLSENNLFFMYVYLIIHTTK